MWQRPARVGMLAVTLASCGTVEIPVFSTDHGADASVPVPPDGSRDAGSCDDSVARILFSTAASHTPVCADRMASNAFRFALCSCGDVAWGQALTTDSFDAVAAKTGGGIGANGGILVDGSLNVGGSLWTAGISTGVEAHAQATIAGELHAAALVHATGPSLSVGADAWVAGGMNVTGDALVRGALHIPQGAPLIVGGAKTVGSTVLVPVQVPSPCDCATATKVDVGGFVETYRASNDNAAAGIDSQWLADVRAPITQALPCGRLFFTNVAAHAPVHLAVDARTAIFVGGDFQADSDFFIDVSEGATLDVFIEGNVLASRGLAFSDAGHPARARVYIGGNGDLSLPAATTLVGNFYAPNAQLVLGAAGPTTIYGSAFVRQLAAAKAPLTVHFDESIARAATSCAAPSSCATCSDCAGQACVAPGACGSCSDSNQCCAPLVCKTGACVLDVP